MEGGGTKAANKPVFCFCKKPAQYCEVTKADSEHKGRPYLICARGECDFFRWADVEYIPPSVRRRMPANPNLIGTGFTEEEIEEEKKPVWEQVATDEKGRRRFHGAWTGGFSAGYFNTVGSAEGWVPKQFVSSRKNRAVVEQDVRDFMDEEDLRDELTTEALKARPEYEAFGRGSKQSTLSKLTDLIVPAKDPIGIKLLRTMGWREGHGVGSKRIAPKKVNSRVVGPAIPPEVLEKLGRKELDEEEEEEEELLTLEPTKMVEYSQKDNTYGIGYDPHLHAPEFRGQTSIKEVPSNTRVSLNSAFSKGTSLKNFGLGAFEEADDEDVYSHDSMENYDIELSSEQHTKQRDQVKGDPGITKYTGTTASLQGYRLSTRKEEKPIWFAPPTVPPNYVPKARLSREGSTTEQTGRTFLEPEKRGVILGEKQLPSNPGSVSVFSYLSPEDRDRLTSLAKKFNPGGIETLNSSEPQLTEWQRQQKEMNEKLFADTAARFKPMKDAIAARFTPSSESQERVNAEPQVEGKHQDTAAAMQMFGKLTRQIEDWYPENLLCKRFNVKNPHPGKKPSKALAASQSSLPGMEFPIEPTISASSEPHIEAPQQDDTEHIEEIEEFQNRPPLDLFKAIFEEDENVDETTSLVAGQA